MGYNQVQSHHLLPPVSNYIGALAALEAYEATAKRHNVVTVYARSFGEGIAFRLYQTDVVTWFPDDSFDVDNYGTQTTSGFARRFLPGGIALNYPVNRSRGGESGGNTAIVYRTLTDAGYWGGARMCVGSTVHFLPQGDGTWRPDEVTCNTMTFPVLDTAKTRAIAKLYHLRDFEAWLPMGTRHFDIEHAGYDLGHCAMALKHRDFRTAAAHLPLIEPGSGFGLAKRVEAVALPIETGNWQKHVTMGSVAKLRLALYEDADLFDTVSVKTVGADEFDRYMARVRELAALGIDNNWGP
jgi:hypothetical protein